MITLKANCQACTLWLSINKVTSCYFKIIYTLFLCLKRLLLWFLQALEVQLQLDLAEKESLEQSRVHHEQDTIDKSKLIEDQKTVRRGSTDSFRL